MAGQVLCESSYPQRPHNCAQLLPFLGTHTFLSLGLVPTACTSDEGTILFICSFVDSAALHVASALSNVRSTVRRSLSLSALSGTPQIILSRMSESTTPQTHNSLP